MTGDGAVTVTLWPTTSSMGVTQRVVGSPSIAAAAREPGLPSSRPVEVAVIGPAGPSAASTMASVARASSRAVPVSVKLAARGQAQRPLQPHLLVAAAPVGGVGAQAA